MFNDARKHLFMIESIKKDKYHESFFNVTSRIEKLLNKDLCEFSLQDYVFLFEQLNIGKNSTFIDKKNKCTEYLTWCIKKGYVASDYLTNIQRLKLSDLANKINKNYYYKSLDELIKTIDEVCNAFYPEEYYAGIIVYYSLLWLGFDGFSIIGLKNNDYNAITNTIFIDSCHIEVPSIVISYLEKIPKDYVCTKSGRKTPTHSKYLFRTNRSDGRMEYKVFERTALRIWGEAIEKFEIGSIHYNRPLSLRIIKDSAMCEIINKEIIQKGKSLTESNVAKALGTTGSPAYNYNIMCVYKAIYEE